MSSPDPFSTVSKDTQSLGQENGFSNLASAVTCAKVRESRTIMAQAANKYDIEPCSISFKGTLQTLEAFQPLIDFQDERGSLRGKATPQTTRSPHEIKGRSRTRYPEGT